MDWDGFDVRSLPALQRVLLTSDGTLTDALEAAFLEPMTLLKIGTETSAAASGVPELDLAAGAPVMLRKILLRGGRTGATYLYAESRIVLDRLPPEFRERLTGSDVPLGRLWAEHRLETRKEILRVWRRPAAELSVHFGGAEQASLLVRSYRVFSGGRPIMLITEYFPEELRHAAA